MTQQPVPKFPQNLWHESCKRFSRHTWCNKTWQDDCGQNYSEFTDNDTTYKVWLEDSASAECRLKLVEEKKLAGASFWKLGFETSDIWDTVTRYIH